MKYDRFIIRKRLDWKLKVLPSLVSSPRKLGMLLFATINNVSVVTNNIVLRNADLIFLNTLSFLCCFFSLPVRRTLLAIDRQIRPNPEDFADSLLC